MYWINYIIKTIIRRLVYLLLKPKILITLGIALLFIIFLDYSRVFAVYEGNDDYTDKNNTIFNAYNIILNDFINRMSNSSDTSTVNEIKELLTNGQNSCYVYYGSDDGSSMINASTFNTSRLYVAIYPKNAEYSSSSSDNYQGIQTQIGNLTNVSTIYEFWDNDIQSLSGKNVQLPVILFNYISSDLLLYLTDNSSSQNNQIVDAIEDQTDATKEVQNSVDNLQNTIVSEDTEKAATDMNTSYDTISNSTSEYDGEINNIVDFYKQLNQAFKDVFDSIVEGKAIELNFGLPFVNKSITFKSDLVRNAIQGSVFYVFLQLCYTTMFGFYLINSFFNIINWLQSGEFLNGKFVSHKNIILKTLS